MKVAIKLTQLLYIKINTMIFSTYAENYTIVAVPWRREKFDIKAKVSVFL